MRPKVMPATNFPMYLVYEDGRVFSLHTNRFLKPFPIGRNNKYKDYKLCNDGVEFTIQAHRLVAQTFLPNPEGLATVNHMNGKHDDNHVENLEWMTHEDNIKHAVKEGLMAFHKSAEDHCRSTFTDEDVHAICRKFSEGVKPRDMASATTLLYQKLFRIYNRDNWKTISIHYDW